MSIITHICKQIRLPIILHKNPPDGKDLSISLVKDLLIASSNLYNIEVTIYKHDDDDDDR